MNSTHASRYEDAIVTIQTMSYALGYCVGATEIAPSYSDLSEIFNAVFLPEIKFDGYSKQSIDDICTVLKLDEIVTPKGA